MAEQTVKNTQEDELTITDRDTAVQQAERPRLMIMASPLRRSESIGKITGAIAAARLKFKKINKNRENPYYKSKYADLEEIIDATAIALAENGVVVLQPPSNTAKGAMVTTLISHVSGEWFEADLILPGEKGAKLDSQTIGSALTYGKRYSQMGMLNVSAEDDDDGNAAVGGGVQTVKMPQAQKKEAAAPRQNYTPPAQQQKPSFTQAFWAAAKKAGKNEADVRHHLAREGYESTTEIPDNKQAQFMDWAEGK